MIILFLEWFHQYVIPEVKKYIKEKGLTFKVLLIIGNVPAHSQSLGFTEKNMEMMFLLPNTVTLQPLDQGIIKYIKATYTHLIFRRICAALDANFGCSIMGL